ncbi:putative copper homeostasis (lipo)protein LpqS [Mycolicibacterium flavescens]
MAVPATRVRAVIALALAFWVVAVATQWTLPVDDVAPPHGPHAVASASVGEHPVVIDHPHIGDAPTPLPPDAFAEAVLPRASTSLIALGLTAALAVVAVWWRQPALAAIRGPPRAQSTVLSGRVILTRLCIARR